MQPAEKYRSDEMQASRRELILRVSDSPPLRKAPRLRELFLYLCERTLNGQEDDLREPSIGADVFGRTAGYDTGSDNIVRVSVFQLRKKLEQYFDQQGATEPVFLSIPKGRYVVEFHDRGMSVAEVEKPVADAPPLQRRRPWIALAGAAILAIVAVAWLTPRERRVQSGISGHEQFWRGVFPADRETYVVVADSGFGLLQDLTGEALNLESYLKGFDAGAGSLPSRYPPELMQRLMGRSYTSVADAAIAFRLGALNQSVGGRAVIRAARSINVRDLKTHNTVLLGSARSNPWGELLRDKLNFRLRYDEQPPRGWIENRNPQPGEPEAFRATAIGSRPGEAFGLLSYMPNLDSTGVIVSISGTNMEGTEAAAELLLNGKHFRSLAQRMDNSVTQPWPWFEAVVRAASVGGAASSPQIVALRRISD